MVVGTPTRIRSVTKRGGSVLPIWKKEKGTYLEGKVGVERTPVSAQRRKETTDEDRFPIYIGEGRDKTGKDVD